MNDKLEERFKDDLQHVRNAMALKWFPVADDLIGGWCVSVIDRPPSEGPGEVANFMTEEMAVHIANLHNRWLFLEQIKGEIEANQ